MVDVCSLLASVSVAGLHVSVANARALLLAVGGGPPELLAEQYRRGGEDAAARG